MWEKQIIPPPYLQRYQIGILLKYGPFAWNSEMEQNTLLDGKQRRGKNVIQKANILSFQSPIALLAIQQGGLFCTVWPFRLKRPFFREFFLRVLWVSPLLKNQHFQISMRPGIR